MGSQYAPPHAQTFSPVCVVLPERGLLSGWLTPYSVYFPPSVMKQQLSEVKTMATASAALTLGYYGSQEAAQADRHNMNP